MIWFYDLCGIPMEMDVRILNYVPPGVEYVTELCLTMFAMHCFSIASCSCLLPGVKHRLCLMDGAYVLSSTLQLNTLSCPLEYAF